METKNSWADGPWKLLETPGNTQDTALTVSIYKLLTANIAQHAIFEPGLHELADYAKKTSVPEFSATKVRSLIDGFASALRDHLKAEIPTLLALQPYESDGVMKIYKECEAAGFNQPNTKQMQDVALPLILGLSDSTFEDGKYVFLAVPKFARYLVHYWYFHKHQGAWRFLPCDMWGIPKTTCDVGR
ncbi:hypothetical protein BOTCAL_0242g00110 [Botryotinia calthae]|uniref:Hemerythrin-like domain-containing protein n=1 Tax=Botryotinia calthae TaxID=38488 RepID=A0A4Y8CZU2_9HELO|nr:hypothetical protein BOTCAL_0242g00110 [Botryotinia calthae]